MIYHIHRRYNVHDTLLRVGDWLYDLIIKLIKLILQILMSFLPFNRTVEISSNLEPPPKTSKAFHQHGIDGERKAI